MFSQQERLLFFNQASYQLRLKKENKMAQEQDSDDDISMLQPATFRNEKNIKIS
jgi:hypothetical protein